uniref:Uncharacterized protein n=1 Tax=Biomphalaria glabrata TaxID=6526 RepID=A0A2C9KWJ7_BIOGL
MSWWTCLVLKSLLAATCMVAVQSQTQPQLVFHFVANTTSKTKLPDSRDIHLQAHLESLLYGLMCKSPGNKFIVRVSPGSGTTEVVDEIIGLHNTSDNVKNCLFPGLNPIKCDEENFCALGNKCTATVMAVCQRHGTMSRWLMTQVVDVTIDQVDGAIVLVRCLTKCESGEPQDEHDHDDENGISYMAVGLIVGGVVFGAFVLVLAVVIWKIRDTKYLEYPDHPHHVHHVHYVTK